MSLRTFTFSKVIRSQEKNDFSKVSFCEAYLTMLELKINLPGAKIDSGLRVSQSLSRSLIDCYKEMDDKILNSRTSLALG